MNRLLKAVLFMFFSAVFLFSAYKAYNIISENKVSSDTYEELGASFVSEPEPEPSNDTQTSDTVPSSDLNQEPTDQTEAPVSPSAPVSVDFDSLREINSDVIGWLYCEDTVISLPVVKGDNNYDYLDRLINGTTNSSGTLFLDYRSSSDLSDQNSVIYGHNMKNKSMFGTLTEYKNQAYYERHPVMYLLTPEQDYLVELFCAYGTDAYSTAYTFNFEGESGYADYLEDAVAMSTFKSNVSVTSEDRILTLSTCSHDYDSTRFVVLGRLVPIG